MAWCRSAAPKTFPAIAGQKRPSAAVRGVPYDDPVKRRRSAKIIAFLCLGAILNVAVAWACALWAPLDWSGSGPVNDEPRIVARLAGRTWGNDLDEPFQPVWFQERHGFGHRYTRLGPELISGKVPMTADYFLEEAGWPMTALEGDYSPRWTGSTFVYDDARGVIHLPFGQGAAPFRPVWPGFAVNTLIYAAGIWLVAAAPGTLRRRRRIARGLCPACAYPAGASDVCTECGRPVQERAG